MKVKSNQISKLQGCLHGKPSILSLIDKSKLSYSQCKSELDASISLDYAGDILRSHCSLRSLSLISEIKAGHGGAKATVRPAPSESAYSHVCNFYLGPSLTELLQTFGHLEFLLCFANRKT